MPLSSVEQATKQLEITDKYLTDLEGQREMISQLKSLTEDIDQQASETSQAVVDQMLAEVIEKYNDLRAKAEQRQTAMQVSCIRGSCMFASGEILTIWISIGTEDVPLHLSEPITHQT